MVGYMWTYTLKTWILEEKCRVIEISLENVESKIYENVVTTFSPPIRVYCRLMVVGWPMDQYKVAVAIATCRQYNYYFRCTIITKCRINLGFSQYLVKISYTLLVLVYCLYNRLASPDAPHYPSTAAIALVHDRIINFVQNIQYFHTIVNNNTYT